MGSASHLGLLVLFQRIGHSRNTYSSKADASQAHLSMQGTQGGAARRSPGELGPGGRVALGIRARPGPSHRCEEARQGRAATLRVSDTL